MRLVVEATTVDVVESPAPPQLISDDLPSRIDIRAAGGIAAVVAVPVLGLLLCLAATHTNALVPQSDRPVPSWLAGPFRFAGFHLPTAVALGFVGLLFATYIFAARVAERVPTRVVVWSVIAFNVIVLIGPPLFSTDVFSYQAYERLLVTYHANPYTHGVWAMQLDRIYPYIGAKWIYTPSVYGPLFTLLATPLALVSVTLSEFTFKLLAMVASMVTLVLIWRAAKLRQVSPERAVALFGLNPLITLFGVGGGHNDLLMLACTTAGLYAWLSRRDRSAGVGVVSGAGIKLTGGLLLPFMLVDGLRDHRFGPRTRRLLGGAAVTALAIAIPSFIVFGGGLLRMVTTLENVQRDGQWQSVPGFILNALGTPNTNAITLGLGTIVAICVITLLVQVWRNRIDWIAAAAWATFAMLVSAGSLLPWYVAWMIPLVGLTTSRRLFTATMWISGIAMFMTLVTYIPGGIPFLRIQ